MVYLEKFTLLDEDEEYAIARARRQENGGYLDSGYPCMMFPQMGFRELDFEPITILHGGNGSGKSTLLNVIALKLALSRISPFNSAELLPAYASRCRYRTGWDDEGRPLSIPRQSRIITSDDVFEYMLSARTSNDEIREDSQAGREDYAALKYGKNIHFTGMENYEDFRLQVLSRRKSVTRRRFLQQTVGKEVRLESNGETALRFFETALENDTLYCLDEPENSLSPRMQLQLKSLLEEKRRYCGCQLVIATHSPFLLAIEGAKIYDLDSRPVTLRKWWELENTRTYFEFFQQYGDQFRR